MAAASEDPGNPTVKVKTDEINDTTMEVTENCQVKIKLLDLKVADLKAELEKRNLDKSGVKSVLIEKLKNALLEDGEDPEEFNFDVLSDSAKTKSSQRKKKIPESETNGKVNSIEETSCEAKEVVDSEVNNAEETLFVTEEVHNTEEEIAETNEISEEMITEAKEEVITEAKEISEEVIAEAKEVSEEVLPEAKEPIEEVIAEAKVSKDVIAEVEEIFPEDNDAEASDVVNSEEANNAEDKMNNEVTLQLSIDEEEAQLNEDDNIMETTKSSEEIVLKLEEVNLKNSETDKICSTPELSSTQTTPVKPSKSNCEDPKEKKILKTPQNSKSLESTVSPKVLKVIGKNDKIKNASVLAKSLWVTALPTTTRAADLKTLFSKQGRVLSVKIVKSTKQTPGKCYGFVTMATSTDATKAIQNLHRTELNGRTISVELTQSEPSALLKKSESKVLTVSSKKVTAKKESVKTAESSKQSSLENKGSSKTDTKYVEVKSIDETCKVKEDKSKAPDKTKSKEKDKSREVKDRDSRRASIRKTPVNKSRPFAFNEKPRYGTYRKPFGQKTNFGTSGFGSSSFRQRSGLSFMEKLRDDRFRQRERFREREKREVERRRAIEISRHKYIERKQKEEAFRLEREKEKLRLEREILERERAEMLKLERERQMLERERLEREREELRRHAELRRGSKRPINRVAREPDSFWDERKKTRYEERSSFHGEKLRLEAPSGSRFEFPSRERTSLGRHELARHPERFSSPKIFTPSPRPEFGEREPRREVTIRSRDDRRVFERSNFRDRDSRKSFSSRERERQSSRRESPRVNWKHDRRVQERIVSPRSSSGQRRMTYY